MNMPLPYHTRNRLNASQEKAGFKFTFCYSDPSVYDTMSLDMLLNRLNYSYRTKNVRSVIYERYNTHADSHMHIDKIKLFSKLLHDIDYPFHRFCFEIPYLSI